MSNSQTQYSFFVGIDLSKKTFDATIVDSIGKKVAYKRFKNTSEEHFLFLSWVSKITKTQENILFCMEHTGTPSRVFMDV